MDLGLEGKTALVCASSRGLGFACAEALAREGVDIVLNGRDQGRLDEAAEELRARSHVTVIAVCGDVTTKEGRSALLLACPAPDILVNNNAGPDPQDFMRIEDEPGVRSSRPI
ncbi:MAG: 3-oxoacyl-ACP reductase [Hyphomicrobiales bacterium]|nr:3-oxoacyl-ACP reductase [Hyphomicrobiales bacterium]